MARIFTTHETQDQNRSMHVTRVLARSGISSNDLTVGAILELWHYPSHVIPAIAQYVIETATNRSQITPELIRRSAGLHHSTSGMYVDSAGMYADIIREVAEPSPGYLEWVSGVPPTTFEVCRETLAKRVSMLSDPAVDLVPCLCQLREIAGRLYVQEEMRSLIIWHEPIRHGRNDKVAAEELDPAAMWADCTLIQLTRSIDPHPDWVQDFSDWLIEECNKRLPAQAETKARCAPSACKKKERSKKPARRIVRLPRQINTITVSGQCGKLTVIGPPETISILTKRGYLRNETTIACRCDCGREVSILIRSLFADNPMCSECRRESMRTHGHTSGRSKSHTYSMWQSARIRARKANRPWQPEWEELTAFIADVGEKPTGHKLRLIKRSLGYVRGNVVYEPRGHKQ